MKRLTLIRHAKSDWDNPRLTDHDRPLNERGLNAAPAVGAELARRGVQPDLLLSSTAVRAAATAELVAAELGIVPGAIEQNNTLYLATAGEYERTIAAIDDTGGIDHVMTFAHNPGTQDFAHHLTGGSEINRFVTCAVAMLELDIEHWGEISAGCGRLVDFFTPRDL